VIRFSKPRTSTDTPRRPRPQIKLALSDDELQIVLDAAKDLDVQKRSLFLERLSAQLMIRSRDVAAAVKVALTGLQHH